jgi:hypothetical protein
MRIHVAEYNGIFETVSRRFYVDKFSIHFYITTSSYITRDRPAIVILLVVVLKMC